MEGEAFSGGNVMPGTSDSFLDLLGSEDVYNAHNLHSFEPSHNLHSFEPSMAQPGVDYPYLCDNYVMPGTSHGFQNLQREGDVHNEHDPHSYGIYMDQAQVTDGVLQSMWNEQSLDLPISYFDNNEGERSMVQGQVHDGIHETAMTGHDLDLPISYFDNNEGEKGKNLHSYGRSLVEPQFHDALQSNGQSLDLPTFSSDCNEGEKEKNLVSNDGEINYGENVTDYGESSGGKKACPWPRVKWTVPMVIVLINALFYMGDDEFWSSIRYTRRKSFLILKKGKWGKVSKVMAERGYYVSPKQCEDKFNELNKRYKRLIDILGEGTSCKVVENPKHLDIMDLPEKAKEEARKILSSENLFYEQMWSYHNANRLFIPHDLDLQKSLKLAFLCKDDSDPDETEGCAFHSGNWEPSELPRIPAKRMREGEECGDVGVGNPFNIFNCNRNSDVSPDGGNLDWLMSRLEEKKQLLQVKMRELEKERSKWERISRIKDVKVDKMRKQNERMKAENERLELELKRRMEELEAGNN